MLRQILQKLTSAQKKADVSPFVLRFYCATVSLPVLNPETFTWSPKSNKCQVDRAFKATLASKATDPGYRPRLPTRSVTLGGDFTIKPVDARNRGQEAARALWRSFIWNLTSCRKRQTSLGLIRFGPVGATCASLFHFLRFWWRHCWKRRKRRQLSSDREQRHTSQQGASVRARVSQTESNQSNANAQECNQSNSITQKYQEAKYSVGGACPDQEQRYLLCKNLIQIYIRKSCNSLSNKEKCKKTSRAQVHLCYYCYILSLS